MRFLDQVFGMEQGYVLDFTNQTFRDLFLNDLDVDIDDPRYSKNGASKAKRLRCYLQSVDDNSAARALKALWQHRLALRERNSGVVETPNLQGRFLQLIDRLEGKSLSNQPSGDAPVSAFGVERFQVYKERLLALNSLQPQPRGYAFEKFLQEMFIAFGLAARESFRLRGEQIDGSFVMEGEIYLIEAKWHNERCGAEPLHAFHGKLEQKAAWTRGIFISYAGFSEDGLHAFGRGKRVVCLDGFDLHEALRREISLPHLLQLKVRKAGETGEPFLSVRNLFP